MAHPLTIYREQNGLSRKQLASKLKCTVGYICHIELGIRKVSPELAMEWEKRARVPRSVVRPDLWPETAAA